MELGIGSLLMTSNKKFEMRKNFSLVTRYSFLATQYTA